MSTSRAIKPKRDEKLLPKWESVPERAPSIMREDSPTISRIVAMVGLFLLVFGLLAMSWPLWRDTATIIPAGLGFAIATLGLGPILYHAFVEREFQFRRLYGFLGLVFLAAAVIIRLWAFKSGNVITRPMILTGPELFGYFGVPALFVGLVLSIAVVRNETDAYFRTLLLNAVGILGAIMIAFGVINGLRDANYLPGEGALMLIMGLVFISAFIGSQEASSERGYQAALALGGVALFAFAGGLARSLMPESTYLVPSGLILMGMSLVYGAVSIGICVDWPVIVLTRRELAAYFLSPVAYLVFIGQVLFGWGMFMFFVVANLMDNPRGLLEPIVSVYVINIVPIFVEMFFVPAVTMRLLSEEKRSGTLEVMLTAPVDETSLVLGKFFASWILYMLLHLPWWIFLVSLRYVGGEEFDYRPVLSFTVCLAAISSGFLAMGLFFSSLTSNQIIAAVFTFVGMMAHLVIFLVKQAIGRTGSTITDVMSYVNFVDFWLESIQGTLSLRYFFFHVSLAIFFLFATVKVLESRKWK